MRILACSVAALVLGAPAAALACTPLHGWFQIDEDEVDVDRTPPGPVVVHGAEVVRAMRPFLQGEHAGPCGDIAIGHDGAIRIDIDPSVDDRTPPSRMGYRLELLGGHLPHDFGIDDGPGPDVDGKVLLGMLDPDDDTEFALRARLIPVDAAGNEGPPSEPFDLIAEPLGCSAAGGSSLLGLAVAALALARRRS